MEYMRNYFSGSLSVFGCCKAVHTEIVNKLKRNFGILLFDDTFGIEVCCLAIVNNMFY